MATVEIDPSPVCVRFARPTSLEDEGCYFETLSILSDDEIRRAERYHFEPDRWLFVASRALVRQTLSQHANVGPAAWRLDTDSYGRPYCVFPAEGRMLKFSVSHTEGLVMCAVVFNRDVGADVERLRECPLDIVDSCFAPVEAQSIRERSGNERAERFFAYWTLKESYIKARGLGLSIPLDKFAFHLSDDRPPRLEIDPVLDDQASGWRFCSLQPTPTHRAALCVYFPDQPTLSISPIWA
jgi:4'-phosphopantetheinyl transferase